MVEAPAAARALSIADAMLALDEYPAALAVLVAREQPGVRRQQSLQNRLSFVGLLPHREQVIAVSNEDAHRRQCSMSRRVQEGSCSRSFRLPAAIAGKRPK